MTKIFCVPCRQMQDGAGNRARKDKSLQGVEVASMRLQKVDRFITLKLILFSEKVWTGKNFPS